MNKLAVIKRSLPGPWTTMKDRKTTFERIIHEHYSIVQQWSVLLSTSHIMYCILRIFFRTHQIAIVENAAETQKSVRLQYVDSQFVRAPNSLSTTLHRGREFVSSVRSWTQRFENIEDPWSTYRLLYYAFYWPKQFSNLFSCKVIILFETSLGWKACP